MIDERQEHLPVEEENYFISMTDMMVGLVFIFVILLMYFALQFRQTSSDLKETTKQLSGANLARTRILEQVQTYLSEQGIKVEIDIQNGILRLPDEILFDSAQAELKPEGLRAVQSLANGLLLVLPCYSDGLERPTSCPPPEHKTEAIFIEGHTDRDALTATLRLRDNWDLSVVRATNTYRELTKVRPELGILCQSLLDGSCTPILSVSGYGDSRPVDIGGSDAAKGRNRRIDIRILMAGPRPSELEEIESGLK
jgi:chemotaxis protein MotB